MNTILDRTKYLMPEELDQLLTYARGRDGSLAKRDYLALVLAANAGLRVRELAALTGNCFGTDLSGTPYLDVWKGKRGKSRRVYLSRPVGEIISRFVVASKFTSLPLLRPRNRGNAPMTRRAIEARFATIGKKAGLERRLYPHKLRHTFAVLYYNSTRHLAALQEQLGHSSLRATSIYASVPVEVHRALVDSIVPVLGNRPRRAPNHQGGEHGETEERKASAPG